MEQNNKDRKPAENLISGIIFRLHDSPAASQHFLPEDAFFFFEDIKKVSSSLSSMHHKEKRNLYFDMGLYNSCAGRAFYPYNEIEFNSQIFYWPGETRSTEFITNEFTGRDTQHRQNSLPKSYTDLQRILFSINDDLNIKTHNLPELSSFLYSRFWLYARMKTSQINIYNPSQVTL